MTRSAYRRLVLLSAPCPAAFLVGMPPMPRSQRAWIVKHCAELSNALAALPDGKAKS